MTIDFVNQVSVALKIERKDMIEKDIVIHNLLADLSSNAFFHENFLFKGGTCLIKCYLGYFRFSEDIDFTWRNQAKFKGLSQKEVRQYLSPVIDDLGTAFEEIAKKRSMDFKCVKSNREYVELGGGNKTLTFKIWYDSKILNRRSFVKVQINFAEDVRFPPTKNVLKSLLEKDAEDLKALFPGEYAEYSEPIPFDTYDIREVLCEKIRAILTRRGVKARDFVDAYIISKKFGILPEDLKKDIAGKTLFALNRYSKYRNNANENKKLLSTSDFFAWGREKSLLLAEIDEKDFYAFVGKLIEFLRDVVKDIEARKP